MNRVGFGLSSACMCKSVYHITSTSSCCNAQFLSSPALASYPGFHEIQKELVVPIKSAYCAHVYARTLCALAAQNY